MIIFLDTEFTDLLIEPRLLSIGMVAAAEADLWRRLDPRNVHDVTQSMPARAAADAYFSQQVDAPIARHHAPCDARALRIAFETGVARHDATAGAALPPPDPARPAAMG